MCHILSLIFNIPWIDRIKLISSEQILKQICLSLLGDENGHTFQDGDNKRLSRESDENRVTTPTSTQAQLPWKRSDEDGEDSGPIKQTEFPSWANNKEYLSYNSPSATFLGKFT